MNADRGPEVERMNLGRRSPIRRGSAGARSLVTGQWRRSREAVTDRLAAHRRLTWLHEAGTRIGTTLDLATTARELAEFAVPRLADGAAVDLLESVLRGEEVDRWRGPGRPVTRAMAVACVDALRALEPDPVGDISVHPGATLPNRCLITRRPVLVERIAAPQYEMIAPTRNAARLLKEAGVHSYMAVPLVARGVLLGIADFIRAGHRPGFTRADLALATQLAAEAAVFIDNARLYGRERETVLTLQRTLLPRVTPTTPGLTVTTCYTPPKDPAGVGGDWFDVVALPGGRTALVVGDVMSHGLAAAATMGRLRTVARTLMMLDIAPDRVLARMDLAARDLEEDQVATCLICVYDPADGSCTVASAGNPPPLLLGADGAASYVELTPGAPLGAGVIPYDPVRVTAPDDSTLFVFTDGLLKTRTDDIDTQLARLKDTVAASAPGRRDAAAVAAAGPGGTDRFDETVMIAGTRLPRNAAGCAIETWELPADGSSAGIARRLVREQLDRWGLTELVDAAELVTSELVGNALRHGNGPGRIRLVLHDRLVLEVADTGPDLPQIQHAPLSAEGGRGLQLVNMLCRRWGSCRTSSGKVVWAEHDLPLGSPSARGMVVA
ncbi:SpoIIE family protein phosphatase [Streptomyces sp. NPDC013953]|uniref:ATP-binding SpoIIE family protein phosphatase n=1 Tax=Streptomyces sp. NPDC013953 TaxID=3364868 RepID=UPI003702B4F3